MSALTEKVAREHRSPLGLTCACGHRPGRRESMIDDRTRHLIEVTEAAVRAAVAADIRDKMYTAAEVETVRSIGGGVAIDAFNSSLFLAARIAEGKQS